VQWKVSSRGGIQVCNQRLQVGMTHACKIVTVEVDQTVLRILDSAGTVPTVVPPDQHRGGDQAQGLRHDEPQHDLRRHQEETW
jgi:hypothetical protein